MWCGRFARRTASQRLAQQIYFRENRNDGE